MLFLYKMHKIKASITAVGSSKRHVALSINTAETMNHILFIWAMNLWIIFHKNWDPFPSHFLPAIWAKSFQMTSLDHHETVVLEVWPQVLHIQVQLTACQCNTVEGASDKTVQLVILVNYFHRMLRELAIWVK